MDVITFPVNLLTAGGLSILLHGVISLPDATSYDKNQYQTKRIYQMIVRQIRYKDIPVPLTAKSLHQGKWHRVDESKYGCKDQESLQSSTTPDLRYQWESDKLTVRHHKPEPRGQPFTI